MAQIAKMGGEVAASSEDVDVPDSNVDIEGLVCDARRQTLSRQPLVSSEASSVVNGSSGWDVRRTFKIELKGRRRCGNDARSSLRKDGSDF